MQPAGPERPGQHAPGKVPHTDSPVAINTLARRFNGPHHFSSSQTKPELSKGDLPTSISTLSSVAVETAL